MAGVLVSDADIKMAAEIDKLNRSADVLRRLIDRAERERDKFRILCARSPDGAFKESGRERVNVLNWVLEVYAEEAIACELHDG